MIYSKTLSKEIYTSMMKSLFFIQIRIRYLKFIENIMLRMADEITIFLPLCFY